MTVFLAWTLINLAVFAVLWVAFSGLRAFSVHRKRRQQRANSAALVSELPPSQRVLVTGATGFIGRRLVEALTSAGHQVIVLTRDPKNAATLRPPFRLVTGLDQIPSDARIDVVINLAGEPIGDRLWTRKKRRKIFRRGYARLAPCCA